MSTKATAKATAVRTESDGPRATVRKTCSNPTCANLQPCPGHAKPAWSGSRRRERTVSGWEQQRRARHVIHTHDTVCHVCSRPGATLADHVIPLAEGGPDTIVNMRPIHIDCHKLKTAEEAARARVGGNPAQTNQGPKRAVPVAHDVG